MKKMMLLLVLISSNALALSDCIIFPVYVEGVEQPYKGKITEVSRDLSFGDCPESILVNERFVSKLIQLYDYKEEQRCVYRIASTAIMCRK